MHTRINGPREHVYPRRRSHERAAVLAVPVTQVCFRHVKDQCVVVTGGGLWFGHVGVEGDWFHGGGGWVCDQSEETTYKIPFYRKSYRLAFHTTKWSSRNFVVFFIF